MRYKTGMCGGSFDPLHLGHIRMITAAASMCEQLYVVLSYSRNRDSVPMEYRYRWIRNSFRHMENLRILLLEDDAASKADYDKDVYWEKGRDYILAQIGCPVDAVFCGSDYKGTGRYESLYGCDVIYFDRSECPVSSTDIRKAPFAFWDYIPRVCRPYYTKKILLTGSESTGKSTLAANLALAYNTNYLEEVGREVCDTAGGEELMIAGDFHEILLRHKAKELSLAKESNKLLFVDTDALVTEFFARFLLGESQEMERVAALADAVAAINDFDLVFFLEPTVAFIQDGTRNPKIEADREMYSRRIKQLLDAAGIPYLCLSGDYLERYREARKIIDARYGLG